MQAETFFGWSPDSVQDSPLGPSLGVTSSPRVGARKSFLVGSTGLRALERGHMEVRNIHECVLAVDAMRVGELIDALASSEDRLWPRRAWPRMRFDRPLGIGARGGHGPIKYFVEDYSPGNSIRFRFIGPKGFDGYHGYEVVADPERPLVLRHTLTMHTRGWAAVSWTLLYRPLHDALLEDSLASAQNALGLPARTRAWSLWVKILRWVGSGGKAPPQTRIFDARPTSPES